MKTLFAFFATAVTLNFWQPALSQNSSKYLREFCIISPDAEYILNNSDNSACGNIKMGEYSNNMNGETFKLEMAILYTWGKENVPLQSVSNTLWSMITKQVHGQKGVLSLEKMNFIPTKNSKGFHMLAIAIWDPNSRKWFIDSFSYSGIQTLYKGVRKFSLKT